MIYRFLIFFFLVCSLLGISSCSSSKKGMANGDLSRTADAASLISSTKVEGAWQALLFKGSADIDHPDYSGSVQVQLIWKKDSLIQIAVRKFGFEVSRIQIGMDSVTLLDRINHLWDRVAVEKWAAQYTSTGSFECLQDLLLRGSCLPDGFQYKLDKMSEGNIMLSADTMGLKWSSIFGSRGYHPVLTEFNGQGALFQARVNGYSSFADKKIPQLWQINFRKGEDFLSMRLNWSEIKEDPHPAFKINIPSHYTRDKML